MINKVNLIPESDAAMKQKKLFTKWNCYLEWTYYFLLHNFHKQFDSKLSQRQIFSGWLRQPKVN